MTKTPLVKPNGYVLWRGMSLIDSVTPVAAILVGVRDASTNRKTGAMLQTYILRTDISPTDAVRTGGDSGICGDCPHRGTENPPGQDHALSGRTCYVNVGQGPLNVWRAYKRGLYPSLRGLGEYCERMGAGRLVRLGTYGDPAAVPDYIWRALVRRSAGHTGYTHQWRRFPHLKLVCMASVDSETEAREA